jgi:hypothetical protein
VDARLLARILLVLIAVAALVGGWVAIQPPDDLLQLPDRPAALRLGPRAASAAQHCREALVRERPQVDIDAIAVLTVAPVADDRDPGALAVVGSFRQADPAGVVRHPRFHCVVDSAGLRSLAVAEPDD